MKIRKILIIVGVWLSLMNFALSMTYDDWVVDNGLTGNDALFDADPDSDGYLNSDEYAFGLDPNVDEGLPLAVNFIEDDRLTIEFNKSSNTTDIVYEIEYSDNLANWVISSNIVSTAPLPGGLETVKYQDAVVVSASAVKRFVRISYEIFPTNIPTPPPPPQPPTPVSLTATAVGYGTILLSWTGPPSSFIVQRQAQGSSGWETIAQVDGTTYSDVGLPPTGNFTYRIISSVAGVTSSPSTSASGTLITPAYEFTVLNPPGAYSSSARGITESGTVAIEADYFFSGHPAYGRGEVPFIWSDDTGFIVFNPLKQNTFNNSAGINGITEAGTMYGRVHILDPVGGRVRPVPTLWPGGVKSPPSGQNSAEIFGGNTLGQYVGSSGFTFSAATTQVKATLWTGSSPSLLSGGNDIIATAINENSDIIGHDKDTADGFLWRDASGSPVLLGLNSKPTAINDNGEIVGHEGRSIFSTGDNTYYWESDSSPRVQIGSGLRPNSINNRGAIVGDRLINSMSDFRAFMKTGPSSPTVDLNDLVVSSLPLAEATGVNDEGWIVGNLVDISNFTKRAFMMKPITNDFLAVDTNRDGVFNDEAIETDFRALIVNVNNDSDVNGDGIDNQNSTIDGVADQSDLYELLIKQSNAVPSSGRAVLSVSDNSKLRIFNDSSVAVIGPSASNGGPNSSSYDIPVAQMQGSGNFSYLIEGFDAGSVLISLTVYNGSNQIIAKDDVRVEVNVDRLPYNPKNPNVITPARMYVGGRTPVLSGLALGVQGVLKGSKPLVSWQKPRLLSRGVYWIGMDLIVNNVQVGWAQSGSLTEKLPSGAEDEYVYFEYVPDWANALPNGGADPEAYTLRRRPLSDWSNGAFKVDFTNYNQGSIAAYYSDSSVISSSHWVELTDSRFNTFAMNSFAYTSEMFTSVGRAPGTPGNHAKISNIRVRDSQGWKRVDLSNSSMFIDVVDGKGERSNFAGDAHPHYNYVLLSNDSFEQWDDRTF